MQGTGPFVALLATRIVEAFLSLSRAKLLGRRVNRSFGGMRRLPKILSVCWMREARNAHRRVFVEEWTIDRLAR
jgi:hypothetical protein